MYILPFFALSLYYGVFLDIFMLNFVVIICIVLHQHIWKSDVVHFLSHK